MIRKPADCRCGYPRIDYNSVTGHASHCPAYHRIQATIAIHQDRPVGRAAALAVPQLKLVTD